jgi:hypothetical protein
MPGRVWSKGFLKLPVNWLYDWLSNQSLPLAPTEQNSHLLQQKVKYHCNNKRRTNQQEIIQPVLLLISVVLFYEGVNRLLRSERL